MATSLVLWASLGLSLALGVGACGSASPPKPSAPGPATGASSAPADSPDSESSADDDSEPLPPGKAPDARILSVTAAAEGGTLHRVKIRFSNPTPSPCTFRAYTLVWSGGKKRVEGKNFVLPPGQRRQRTLRVDDKDGKLDSLDAKSAWIDLETDCTAP
jgi:hypothetical protein